MFCGHCGRQIDDNAVCPFCGQAQANRAGAAPAANAGYRPAANAGYTPAANPGYTPAANPSYTPAANPGYTPAANPGYAPAANAGYTPVAPAKLKNKKPLILGAVIAVIVLVVVIVIAVSGSQSIVGHWVNCESGVEIEFNKDGTGTGEGYVNFDYEVKDNGRIIIYDEDDHDDRTSIFYTIKNGKLYMGVTKSQLEEHIEDDNYWEKE